MHEYYEYQEPGADDTFRELYGDTPAKEMLFRSLPLFEMFSNPEGRNAAIIEFAPAFKLIDEGSGISLVGSIEDETAKAEALERYRNPDEAMASGLTASMYDFLARRSRGNGEDKGTPNYNETTEAYWNGSIKLLQLLKEGKSVEEALNELPDENNDVKLMSAINALTSYALELPNEPASVEQRLAA